jgi:hypothetical protein
LLFRLSLPPFLYFASLYQLPSFVSLFTLPFHLSLFPKLILSPPPFSTAAFHLFIRLHLSPMSSHRSLIVLSPPFISIFLFRLSLCLLPFIRISRYSVSSVSFSNEFFRPFSFSTPAFASLFISFPLSPLFVFSVNLLLTLRSLTFLFLHYNFSSPSFSTWYIGNTYVPCLYVDYHLDLLCKSIRILDLILVTCDSKTLLSTCT